MMMMMMTLLTGSCQVSNFFEEESSSVSLDSAAIHSHLFGDLVAKRQVEKKKSSVAVEMLLYITLPLTIG